MRVGVQNAAGRGGVRWGCISFLKTTMRFLRKFQNYATLLNKCVLLRQKKKRERGGKKNGAEAELMDLPCVDPEFTLAPSSCPATHSLAHSLTPTGCRMRSRSLTPSHLESLRSALHAVDGSCCKSVLESLDPISAPSLLCYLLSSLTDLSSSRRSFLSPLSPLYISTLFSALNSPIQD